MPRKHLIASQTNKKQQSQAKLWQKLAREIKAAVNVGGPNIEANPRLKAAVAKALANNLSRDSINRNINGTNTDKENLEALEYEAYGPNGLQIIIGVLTSNSNRSASNIRGYLSKLGGHIVKPNAVKAFFETKGYIIAKKNNTSLDQLMELTMEFGILDLIEQEDGFEIFTTSSDYYKVVDHLKANNIELFSFDLKLFPMSPINDIGDNTEKLTRFIDSCEDDEDIQWTVTNYEPNNDE
ncbi:MAG: DNA-binding regulatory protein, YebC/PmpR family [Candidatus Malacoplasma girerdii]|nr:MAG: DNA-binding regulatory protein, YebC/PmpR family [Candidatus Malacoplasma girerdii]